MFKAQYCLSFLGVTSNNRCPDSVCDVRLATAPAPSRAWAFCTWMGGDTLHDLVKATSASLCRILV